VSQRDTIEQSRQRPGFSVGTPTRAEIIVSFGNAKAGATSSPNVDINGNGLLDADEVWVQSVAARPSATVPAETPGNETVTLSRTRRSTSTRRRTAEERHRSHGQGPAAATDV